MIENHLNNRFITLYLLPFLLGGLSVLSFQPFNFSFINFFIFPLIFYLIIYINKKSKSIYRKKPYKKNLFIFGSAFGFGFYLIGLHWIVNSLTFDESFKILIPFGLILIPLFLSLFFSFTILLVGPFLRMNLGSILLFSGALAFSDYIRDKILTGFPWNLWAYTYSWSLEIIQILNIIGLFAFNLISISIFTFPVVLFFKINLLKKILNLFLIIFAILMLYIYGNHSINSNKKKLELVDQKFNVKVISPNFELEYNLEAEEIKKRLNLLIRYSEPIKNQKTLFVWPEGVFSGYSYYEIINLKKIFIKHFDETHFILFGINRLDPKKKGTYNSLVIVNNKMEIIREYKKQKLVPFGEFLPFEKLLTKLGLKKITEGHGSFLKGSRQNNLVINELSIFPLICYEIIFTNLIRLSEESTNLIVNISEDGWFGSSIGPHQHFAKAIFRSVERDTFLVRSANKGISAIINNKGEVLKKLYPNETGYIQLEVPLIKNKNKNKNDLIFFILLFTYIFIFYFYKKNNEK